MSQENIAHPHTIKKFELVEKYVTAWVQKLINFPKCKEIVFIDCMCNNGTYKDSDGKSVEGTPIRVAKIISKAMTKYSEKTATLYFNDKDLEKIEELRNNLPDDTNNFRINLSNTDGNELLRKLQPKLLRKNGLHYLLFYDPFEAAINWEVLAPYFFGWGEVILNHMVSDTIRAIKSVKRPQTITKYEQTYLTPIEKLTNLHGDKKAYDNIIKDIIRDLGSLSKRQYYFATFPFFIKTNVLIYNIIFFTRSIDGFKLFKTTAWKTFGGKSSNQNTYGRENLLELDLGVRASDEDMLCYNFNDIAKYIIDVFKERKNIPLKEIYKLLDNHPVFPTVDYKKEIRTALKNTNHCILHRSNADFF